MSLMPCGLTIKAFRFMNTEYLIAFVAVPLFFFVSNEMPYADLTLAFTIFFQFLIRHMITSYRNFFEI
jgi:hypothetical protein